MKITLDQISKRYNRERVFHNLTYSFEENKYAITGPNGSGKSTLLQIISGYKMPTEGTLKYELHKEIPVDEIYKYLSITTPYLELIEEFTLEESLKFHFKFKEPIIPLEKITDIAYLRGAENKQIKNFSSGMKQRLKLALAFYSKSHIMLLDEPTSNMDEQGIKWYLDQINLINDRTIIIASNQSVEYNFCANRINILDYQ